MIYLITGQPGAGKTLYTLRMLLDFQKEGRQIFSFGIPGENRELTGFLPLDDPKSWESLPDNAVIAIDECYNIFPNRNAASRVPAHVEALARHRHRGFDFVLTCQQAKDQLDPFLRGLIEEHRHVRRKSKKLAVIKTWDRFISDPDKTAGDSFPVWKYDESLYPLYKSSTKHTSRRSLPWWLWIVIPVGFFVLYVGYLVSSGKILGNEATAAPPTTAPAQAGVGVGGGVNVLGRSTEDRTDYVKWITPRIAGVPWSAPAYDKLTIQDVSEITCMASGDGLDGEFKPSEASCTCLSEQATRIEIEADLCRHIARHGLYNPFKRRAGAGPSGV